MTKRAVYVGRYSPFHKGHLTIMKKKLEEDKPLLVLVRDTHYDLYPAPMRKRMIEAAMDKLNADCKVVIIDDIESINYGRGVGYEINEIEVKEKIKAISATDIRERIQKRDDSWREFIPKGADKVLEDYLKDRGVVVWLTGLPRSGKKTIANLASEKLETLGIRAERLDGGIMRDNVSKDLGFSKEDRNTNIQRAAFIAKLLSRNGGIVLCSLVTPYEAERRKLKKELEEDASYSDVFVKASVETCRKRDPELYNKAEKGEIKDFTGVSDPYEEPKKPDLVLDTEKHSAEECANQLVEHIEGILKNR